MIDTVKFKIKVTSELYEQIESLGKTVVQRDNQKNEEWLRYLKSEVEIGSYDRSVTLFAYEAGCVYLECSLPKQYHGENVHLLYPSEITQALDFLHQKITAVYPTFPSYRLWRIIRLDICYAWRLSDQLQVTRLLDMLKLLDFPRKHRLIYKTGVMYTGRRYSIKFYLKNKDFLHHDYADINKVDPDKAYELFQLSLGVIRFEITYRHEQLIQLFEKNTITYLDLLDNNFLEQTMRNVINRLLQNRNKESMTDGQILNVLKDKYKSDKAMRLFNFYKSYYSDQEHLKRMLKDNYHPSTIWRNLKDISNAGVGISSSLIDFDFNLLIPSPLVVNTDPTVAA